MHRPPAEREGANNTFLLLTVITVLGANFAAAVVRSVAAVAVAGGGVDGGSMDGGGDNATDGYGTRVVAVSTGRTGGDNSLLVDWGAVCCCVYCICWCRVAPGWSFT